MTDQAHVFISYVTENDKLAGWIAAQLRANGLDPWFSKEPGRIVPGDEWQRSLRTAVQEGGFYLPLFTRQWAERSRSAANQELQIAAEEARMRPPGRRWLIPVKVDEEPLPPIDLGGGRHLADVQYVDVQQLGWERSLKVLLQAMGVREPVLERGEPLAPGFGANAHVVGGFVTYRNFSVPIPELDGTIFAVTDGYVTRNDEGEMVAMFYLRAPFEELQKLNVSLGLDSINVASPDRVISTEPTKPSRFSYIDEKDPRAPGMPLWKMGSSKPLRTAVPIEQVTGYEATGHLNALDQIVGTFEGYIITASPFGKIRVTFEGDFQLQLKDTVGPPT